MTKKILNIIGGGLAGSEAAWQAAKLAQEHNLNLQIKIWEMRKQGKMTPAHQTNSLAELVCSNSFRNDDQASAIGLLHQEMRLMQSLIISCGDKNRVPAGSALAVDRDEFSYDVQEKIENNPYIEIISKELTELPIDSDEHFIIATGPLTSDSLAESIRQNCNTEHLAFFDAIAPIIYRESINFDIAWFQSRYDKTGPGGNGKDYINCPLTKEQYFTFVENLISADKTEFKVWEKNTPYFNACLPIEVMAERGLETLRFGPMKPVGLTNPHNPNEKPYAIVQLRQDNKLGTLFNMVGFQTKLKYGAQKEIFRTIPALENAEFARLGGIHRNSFIKSPELLKENLSLKKFPHIMFAGQVTGVEGYVESAAIGLLAGRFAIEHMFGQEIFLPPRQTALGSLLAHITGEANAETFQPMNINFGLIPELSLEDKFLPGTRKKLKGFDKKHKISERALNLMKLMG